MERTFFEKVYKHWKDILIIFLLICTLSYKLKCSEYKRLIRDGDIRVREYRERLDDSINTISECRGTVRDIREGLENSTGKLQDTISRLRKIREAVETLENSIDSYYFRSNSSDWTNNIYDNEVKNNAEEE